MLVVGTCAALQKIAKFLQESCGFTQPWASFLLASESRRLIVSRR